MAKVRGVDILVEIDLDQLLATPTGIPDWKVVGGQQNATLSEEVEAVDTTTKDSDGAVENEYGLYSWSVSADGLAVTDDEGYDALKTAIREKKKVRLRINDGGGTETGTALVTSREVEGPYDGYATYSTEFTGSGKITPAA